MSFPDQVDAVLLAGGQLDPQPTEEPPSPGKGLLPVGAVPMAARPLRALVDSPRVRRIVLVSPVPLDPAQDPVWRGVDEVALAGHNLLSSVRAGLEKIPDARLPVLTVAGDLPFLSAPAVTDFIQRCGRRPEASIWYGYMRKEISEERFPGVPHTWARLVEGTFCGTGLVMLRPEIVGRVGDVLRQFTQGRKNPFKLAALLGWSTILSFVTRRLTVARAEAAALKLLGFPCAGIESPFAETAFNVDNLETLREARRLATLPDLP